LRHFFNQPVISTDARATTGTQDLISNRGERLSFNTINPDMSLHITNQVKMQKWKILVVEKHRSYATASRLSLVYPKMIEGKVVKNSGAWLEMQTHYFFAFHNLAGFFKSQVLIERFSSLVVWVDTQFDEI
jgi:hypothetical protein